MPPKVHPGMVAKASPKRVVQVMSKDMIEIFGFHAKSDLVDNYRELFTKFNTKGTGHISAAELQMGLMKLLEPSVKVSNKEAASMVKVGDVDGDGQMGPDDWLRTLLKHTHKTTGAWWLGWLHRRRGAFHDTEGKLAQSLGAVGDPGLKDLTREQLDEYKALFEKLDSDGSGLLDRFELLSALRTAGLQVGPTDIESMLKCSLVSKVPPASAHEEEKDDEDDGKRRASKKGGKGEKGEKGAEALKEEPKPEVMVDLDGFIYMLLKNRSGGQKAWWKGWLQKKTKEDLREEQLAFFSDVFDQMDKDGGGDVSPLELREMFETLGIKVSPEEAQAMVAMADTDGDARVSKSEFLDVIARASEDGKWQLTWIKTWRKEAEKAAAYAIDKPSAARQDPRTVLSKADLSKYKKAFEEMDMDKNGTLDAKELLLTMEKCGAKGVTLEDAGKMIEHADESRDGMLDYEEFLVCMVDKRAGWQWWWKKKKK